MLCVRTMRPFTEKIISAWAKGCDGDIIPPIKDYQGMRKSTYAFLGVLRGSGDMLKRCMAKGYDYYFIDHAYFLGGHDRNPAWYRATKNGHVAHILKDRPSDRYEKYFKQDIKPWNKSGSKILVLPPTNAIANFFNANDWLDNTLKVLKENTDREIVVRNKPYNPGIAKDHVGATIKIDIPTDKKLGKIDWNEYYAMVTFNSNTLVESFANGVPVFCNSSTCSATPIAETDFTKIETPVYGDRVGLFSSLAYNNYSMEEMANGTAWELLNNLV